MANPKQGSCDCERSMDAGELTPLVAEFVANLETLGYSSLTMSGYEASARHFACWLARAGHAAGDVDDDVVRRFASHRCHCPGFRRLNRVSKKYARRARRFVEFLADRGLVQRTTSVSPPAHNQRVRAFQNWLQRHRGISDRTIDRHGRMVMRLLPALGSDPGQYHAHLVRQVILAETKRASIAYVKTMAMALRGYLRFLAASGLCRPGLDQAVPTIPQWRLSALPRYIGSADVERLIATCDLTTLAGVRDRAVLCLLARLGLRAGDIVALRLDDIEWRQATLSVRGKSRRETRLPLPQDAGDAVLDYLRHGRPKSACDRLFLTSTAPFQALSGSTVSSIVRRALDRARIAAPSKGANLLRQSAATAMLRRGATLDMVGAVLRHRSPDMTAHYAKVDVLMLQQIARPWPGDA
jgi:site-specific recombinase XerD